MPQFPQNSRKVGIDKLNLPRQGTQAVQREGAARQRVIDSVQKGLETMEKVKQYRQTNEANALVFEQLNEQRSLSDSDMSLDYEKYNQEIDKIGSEASRTITSQEGKDKFAVSFARQAESVKFGIRSNFRRKELVSAQAALTYQGEQIINAYPKMDAVEQATSLTNFKLSLQEGVDIGLHTQDVADIKWEQQQASVFKAEADYDSVVIPEQFLTNDRNDYNIPDDEYKDAKETAIDTIEKDKKMAKKEQDLVMIENETQLTLNLSQKRVESLTPDEKADTLSMVNKLMLNKQISSTYGQAFIDLIKSPNSADAKVKKFTGLASYSNAVFAADTPEKKREAVIALMERNTQGKLTQDKIDVVLASAMEAGDNVRDNWIQNTIGWFQTAEKKAFDKETEGKTKEEKDGMASDRMTFNFFVGLADGKDLEKARDDAVLEVKSEDNEFYRAFLGKNKGDEVLLPDNTPVIFTGHNLAGQPTFDIKEL